MKQESRRPGKSVPPVVVRYEGSITTFQEGRSMSGRRLFRSLAGALLSVALLSLPGTSQAARTRPVNLEEMTQRADRIFSGRCVNIHVARDHDLDQVVTYVTF